MLFPSDFTSFLAVRLAGGGLVWYSCWCLFGDKNIWPQTNSLRSGEAPKTRITAFSKMQGRKWGNRIGILLLYLCHNLWTAPIPHPPGRADKVLIQCLQSVYLELQLYVRHENLHHLYMSTYIAFNLNPLIHNYVPPPSTCIYHSHPQSSDLANPTNTPWQMQMHCLQSQPLDSPDYPDSKTIEMLLFNQCTQTPCRLWQVEHYLHSSHHPLAGADGNRKDSKFTFSNSSQTHRYSYSQITARLITFWNFS